LPVSSGVLGDTNQFDARAQGSEGSGSVNLRGLGPQRTLVLMNGRRLVANPFGQVGTGIVDTNILPSAAIGRIEVLKDGAAATYGSDAIGGVVNFITRQDFDGLEASGSYKIVDGSDGDYTGSLVWGHNFDNGNVLVTAGLQHRSELSTKERDWALQSFANNPQGGWSGGNGTTVMIPTLGATNAPVGTAFIDNGCTPLGGFVAGGACNFQFTRFDNITEKEDRYQLYAEVNVDLSDAARFHGEALFSHTNVPDWKTSPSYLALQSPNTIANGGVTPSFAGGYFVPNTNPGFIAYNAANPGAITAGATGAYIPGVRFRPYGLGGNPLFNNGASEGTRMYDAARISGGLAGEFGGGIGYDFTLTYSQETGTRQGYDAMVNRLQLALRGYGSLASDTSGGCTAAETANFTTNAGNAALGCYWFNPFSNSIQTSAVNGATNPAFSPSLANSADLTAWFFLKGTTKSTQRLFTADAVFNGSLGFTLGGGDAEWAIGAQYRRNYYESTNSDLYNLGVTPCIDTPTSGTTNCAVRNGPFLFLAGGATSDLNSDVYAAFGEVQLPFSDRFNVSVAARYEDYGAFGGSTFNPKISGKFDVSDNLSLRGSAGSTFRAPAITNVAAGFVTGFSFIGGSFRAIDFFGNPKLEPETADTYSVGAIFKTDALKVSLDYWGFNFDKPIASESSDAIVSALFPTLSGTGNCANPAYAGLASRFTFATGVCNIANISRLRVNTVNGGSIETTGFDLLVDWRLEDFLGGELGLGGTGTYTQKYEVGALSVEGIQVSPARDRVGLLNYQQNFAYPLPQLKGSVYAEYERGSHNVRVTMNYVDSYTDERATITGAGKEIDSTILFDVSYRAFLPLDTTFALAIDNVADEDPSFARLDLNYDPFTGSPYGRTIKIGLTKRF
jgi:iron complex outermembrane recepter protein